MKKIVPFSAFAAYLLSAGAALATHVPGHPIQIQAPNKGYNDLGVFITAAINLIFIVAAVAVLIMLVWGAIQWIFSGGEKEAVASARNRILHALIGLAVLAVAFAIAVVFGRFVNIDLFNLVIPTPTNSNPGGTAPGAPGGGLFPPQQ